MMLALKQAGAEIAVGACNVDSTNDAIAAYLVTKGISVYGWQGMSQVEYQENLDLVRSFGADLFDHYTAVMLLGIAWMFDGIPDDSEPGLQQYPSHLEREIAELSVKIHSQG